MKAIFLAMLVAIGLGLAGSGGAWATPVNGARLGTTTDLQNMIEQAQYRYHRRWRGQRCRNVRICRGYGFYRRCWWERRCW